MTIRARATTDPTFTTVNDMAALTKAIGQAAQNGTKVRVRGAMHSVRDSIVTDPGTGVNLILGTGFETIGFNPNAPTFVTVGAGRRLGGDPDENIPPTVGMLDWLATRTPALSVPDLGGITHQSVGGFLSTGSSGGSLKYTFESAIQSISFVDGTGTPHTLDRSPDNDFAALGVSMGLFGVITSIDINPVPRFAIAGKESTLPIGDPNQPFDLFSSGSDGLAPFLAANDYCRVMWWPQADVTKLVTWTAQAQALVEPYTVHRYRELGDPDENPLHYPPEVESTLIPNVIAALLANGPAVIAFAAEHARELPADAAEFIEQTIAAIILKDGPGLTKILTEALDEEVQEFGVDLYFSLLGNRVTNPLATALFTAIFTNETEFESTWSPLIMNGIFLIDDPDKCKPGPQIFNDYADLGLPMDNQISDRLMPTEFTELWIPIEKTAAVMGLLRDHYVAGGYAATGTYACELYAAKASEFWMSPSYGTDVIRVDLFWFGRNGDSTPQLFYQQFWDLLKNANIPFRPHWGKYLPPSASYGQDWYRKVYPQFDAFLALRAKYDPKQIFVTDYWREQLGITQPS